MKRARIDSPPIKKSKSLNRLRLTVATIILLSTSVWGQTTSPTDGATPSALTPGAPAGSYSLSGFENINLYNGNLNFALPLLQIGGRGEAQMTSVLAIERHWQVRSPKPVKNCEVTNNCDLRSPWPNFWGLSPGYGPGIMQGRQPGVACGDLTLTRLTFTASEGTEFELRDKASNGQPASFACNTSPGASRGTVFVTADGSAATFVSDVSINDWTGLAPTAIQPSGYLSLRDSTRYRIDSGLVTWLEDRNGNRLTFAYSGSRVVSITDTLNRKITFNYSVADVAPYNTCDQIIFQGFGGAARMIRVSRDTLASSLRVTRAGDSATTKTFAQLFPELPGSSGAQFNPTIVSSVWLPDGRRYRLYYNVYGELARVELPTGGTLEYDYVNATNPNDGISRRVVERRVYPDGVTLEGRTTYGGPGVVQVDNWDASGALLARSKHYFFNNPATSLTVPWGYPSWQDGREFKTELFASDGSTVLRRTTDTWEQRAAVSWWTGSSLLAPANDPRVRETSAALVDSNQVSKQTFGFDDSVPFNNRNNVKEYDYGTGAPGALIRETRTTFITASSYTDVAGPHLRSLASRVSTYDGSGVERSRTTVEFDNYAADATHALLVDRPAISGLDPSFNTAYTKRGSATATTRYLLNSSGTVTGSISAYQQYDIAGNIVKVIDGRGNATNVSYSDCFGSPDGEATLNSAPLELGAVGQASFAYATTITNPAGDTISGQFDYYLGRPVDGKDANGIVASGFYEDMLDRPTKVIRAFGAIGAQNQTTFSYDDVNHVIATASDLNSNGDGLLVSKLLYDGLGRTTETQQYEGGTNYIANRTRYDALNRPFKTSNPFRPWQNETAIWTTSAFDSLGRVTAITTPDNAVVSTGYSGNTMTVTDQAGKTRKTVTDALGRLLEVYEAPNDPNYNYRTSYDYDVLGNLLHVYQGSQTRTFTFDSLSRLRSATNPESGTVDYDYDENGNLKTKMDPRNVPNTSTRVTTSYVYDALNRLTSRSYNDGTPNVTYTYDATDVPNSRGRLTRISSSVSSYTYGEYDALGRVKTGTQTTAGQAYTMSYEYNAGGAMISQKYPSDRTVKIEYDEAGRIAGVRNNATGGYYAGAAPTDAPNRVQYSAAGAIQAMRLGNSLWEHTNFNARLQPVQIGLGSASTNSSILQLDYAYGTTNNNGNVQSQTITVPTIAGVTGFTANQTYTYDSLDRLATAQENNGSSWKQIFDYDRFGNRKFISGTTLPALTPANNPIINPNNNRIDSTAAGQGNILYDNAGNLTREVGGHTYQYDAESKLVSYDGGATSAGGAGYNYDGDGRRVKKVVGGAQLITTVFVYDISGQLVAEYADSNPSGGGTSYITSDTLGSPRVITGTAQQVVAGTAQQVVGRHDYLPFGEELFAGTGGRTPQQNFGADNLRRKFTGYERDLETDLDYAQARYYSSKQGRFTSVDPLLASGRPNRPQSWNRYAYVLNNPLRLIDPSGLMDKKSTPKDPPGEPADPPQEPKQGPRLDKKPGEGVTRAQILAHEANKKQALEDLTTCKSEAQKDYDIAVTVIADGFEKKLVAIGAISAVGVGLGEAATSSPEDRIKNASKGAAIGGAFGALAVLADTKLNLDAAARTRDLTIEGCESDYSIKVGAAREEGNAYQRMMRVTAPTRPVPSLRDTVREVVKKPR